MVGMVSSTMELRNIKPVGHYLNKMSPEEFSNHLIGMMAEIYAASLIAIAKKVKDGMPNLPNVGLYALSKRAGLVYKQSYGHMTEVSDSGARYHSLGIVTGMLRQGILNTPMGAVKRGSGRNAALAESTTFFTNPDYLWFVHEGKQGMRGRVNVKARPFITETTKEIEKGVGDQLDELIKQVDVFNPGTFKMQWSFRGVAGGAIKGLPSEGY